jgi:trans-aconitate 2-methyltransferase
MIASIAILSKPQCHRIEGCEAPVTYSTREHMRWNPKHYLDFGDQRTRPAVDLLARVPLARAARIADLGCGPGNATRLLLERWPEADVVGVDGSSDMLAKAAASGLSATWVEADIAAWAPEEPLDLIYSNAALHWLVDHASLFPRLISRLDPAGVLAVQMPRNFEAPSHALLREIARDGRWAGRLGGFLEAPPVAAPEWYYDLLAPHAAKVDVWETVYLHVLDGEDPVLRWTRGTTLRPVIAALDEEQFAAFEATYAARLRTAYPRRPDGRTLFPFRRLFIVAQRQ